MDADDSKWAGVMLTAQMAMTTGVQPPADSVTNCLARLVIVLMSTYGGEDNPAQQELSWLLAHARNSSDDFIKSYDFATRMALQAFARKLQTERRALRGLPAHAEIADTEQNFAPAAPSGTPSGTPD